MVSEVLLGMPWENNHYVEYGANAWLLFTLVSQILLIYKAAHGHHFSSALFSKSALYVCKYSQILLLHSAFHPRIIQPPKLLLFLNLRILKFTVYTVQFCECQQMYSSTYPPPLKYHTQPFHCSPQSLVFHLISTPPTLQAPAKLLAITDLFTFSAVFPFKNAISLCHWDDFSFDWGIRGKRYALHSTWKPNGANKANVFIPIVYMIMRLRDTKALKLKQYYTVDYIKISYIKDSTTSTIYSWKVLLYM